MTPAELMARLESHYSFECEGGPLRNCVEWHQLKAHVSTLQSAPPAGAQGETPAVVARWLKFLEDKDRSRVFVTSNDMMRQAIVGAYHTAYAQQAEEIARLRAELMAWEEREAAVCPEDTAFEDVIKRAESQVQALQDHLSEAQQRIEMLIAERDEARLLVERAVWRFMETKETEPRLLGLSTAQRMRVIADAARRELAGQP